MKSSRAPIALGVIASVWAGAGIADARTVAPPKSWTPDTEAALSLTTKSGAMPQFGGRRGIVTTEVYRAPAGGVLYVTRVVANVTAAERDVAASAQLDELGGPVRRAGQQPKTWRPQAVAASKQLEATLEWSDPSTSLVHASRMIVAADAQQIVSIAGECMLAADAAPDVVAACKAALATLDPDVAPASRVALALVEVPASAGGAPTMGDAPQLSGGDERPTLAPMSFPEPTREPDRRPVYVGLGLVVLAAIFWWNRKRRERFEAEHGEGIQAARARRTSRDADADDLHAAAEEATPKGDPPDDPAKPAPATPASDDTKEDTKS